jgi:secondary thiamine-phosphate synthase enzyme
MDRWWSPHTPGLHEVTATICGWAEAQGIVDGLLTIFCRHTSASLLIQENASPTARRDLERFFTAIAPEGTGYEHADEGADDMPAHLRSALTQTHLAMPVRHGALLLGQWQGIYLFEHRRAPSPRELALHLLGS